MSLLQGKGQQQSQHFVAPYQTILNHDEIRSLLGGCECTEDLGTGLDDCNSTPSDAHAACDWELLSREVFSSSNSGPQTIVETSIMRVNSFGSLVRCVVYASNNPARVNSIVMEFVPDNESLSAASYRESLK